MSDGLNISAVSTKNSLRKLSATHELKLEGAAPPQDPIDSSLSVSSTSELQVMKTEVEKLKQALQMTQEIYEEIEKAYLSLFPSEEK